MVDEHVLRIACGGFLNWNKRMACMGCKGVNFNIESMFICNFVIF